MITWKALADLERHARDLEDEADLLYDAWTEAKHQAELAWQTYDKEHDELTDALESEKDMRSSE